MFFDMAALSQVLECNQYSSSDYFHDAQIKLKRLYPTLHNWQDPGNRKEVYMEFINFPYGKFPLPLIQIIFTIIQNIVYGKISGDFMSSKSPVLY